VFTYLSATNRLQHVRHPRDFPSPSSRPLFAINGRLSRHFDSGRNVKPLFEGWNRKRLFSLDCFPLPSTRSLQATLLANSRTLLKVLQFGWFRPSTQFVSSDSHGNEAVVASYNRATDVQSKRDVADGDRPLDHDADQGTWRQLVCGCHQHAVAADIHRPARTLYLLWPLDGVTSNKLERKASLPAALSFIQRSQVLAPFGRD
jgi:hypothetical protein